MGEEEKTSSSGAKKIADKSMAALGKVGVKDIFDIFALIAGLWSFVFVLVELFMWFGSTNGWYLVYLIVELWVFFSAAFWIKMGPLFSKWFKSQIGAFSFLREENDASNFAVIVGAYTVVLNCLSAGGVNGFADPKTYLWLVPLALYAIYLLKGKIRKA